jgi:circadian clock protein KaiC
MPFMHSENKPTQSRLERVSTGIPGLDEIISGGFPKGTITLVSGPPGGGKTILCCQYLYQGVQEGDRCLFLTLDKKVEGILAQTSQLGMNFQPGIEAGTIKFLYLNINKKLIYESMVNEILSGNYDRIVLDSITPLSEMPIYISNPDIKHDINYIDPEEFTPDGQKPIHRLHLHFIMSTLETSTSTSLITSELPTSTHNLSRDGLSEFLSDGVIVLSVDPTMDRRKLTVMKMRSTKHTLKPHDMEIQQGGIALI